MRLERIRNAVVSHGGNLSWRRNVRLISDALVHIVISLNTLILVIRVKIRPRSVLNVQVETLPSVEEGWTVCMWRCESCFWSDSNGGRLKEFILKQMGAVGFCRQGVSSLLC